MLTLMHSSSATRQVCKHISFAFHHCIIAELLQEDLIEPYTDSLALFRYPQDCTRCKRAGHRCVIDPSFRRRGNRE